MAASRLRCLCEWILRWRFPAVPIAIAVLLGVPSLWNGLQGDDLSLYNIVRNERAVEGLFGDPWNPFSFLDGDPARNRQLIDAGWLPWWSDPECKASFWRPVTSLTHVLDFRVWPRWPVVMHAQSLAWYALLVWAVAALYRRLIGATLPLWAAALAALLFAVDDSHAMPVGWLANRNALVAGAFGVLALLAHDRWRRDGWRWGAVLAPLALLAALLSKEAAVSVGGYLLAYALFIERGPWRRRLLSLLPCLLVGIVWYGAYKGLGHGSARSSVYIDPGQDPLRYAWQALRHAPLLLCGQWALPPSELGLLLSRAAFWWHWGWALAFVSVVGVLMAPLAARDRVARFWALGMVLSLLPACATFAHDRLLMFVGIGAMGLLAQWLGGRVEGAAWVPTGRAWRALATAFAGVAIAAQLVLAPVQFVAVSMGMKGVGALLERQLATTPSDEAVTRQTLIYANSMSALADVIWVQTRLHRKERVPARILRLAPSVAPATLVRTGERTLVVRPRGGYLPPQGAWYDTGHEPAFSPIYVLRSMDGLFRSEEHPLRLGDRVELTAATVEITALTDDGRPAEATFRFRVPLEDDSLRWLVHRGLGCEPFAPPAVGQSVDVPAPF